MNLKDVVLGYLNTGRHSSNDADVNQQILVANLFAFIGYTLTAVMGVSALSRSDYFLGGILLIASALFFFAHLILRFSRAKNAYTLSANLVTISLVILMLDLIYTGGYLNTGPLWIYVVPPVALFFGGIHKGLLNLGFFVIIVSVMLFYPGEQLLLANYSPEFKSRLIYSFLTVSALFAFYEHARQVSYKHIQSLSDKFEQQARRDPLSGLQNRRGMLEKLSYEQERSKRNDQAVSLLMLDIDHFKQVNDDLGHDTGDYVIKELANILIGGVRKQDTVARWGGEEFLLMLPETSEHQAYILAEKLRNMVAEKEFSYQQKTLRLTVSVGVHQIMHSDSLNQAISSADANLYRAKDQGRNRSLLSN